VLIDCRHEPQPVDIDFMHYLGESNIPFQIIFTKADKLKPNALTRNIDAYTAKMLESWEEMPEYFITSASNREGKEALIKNIYTISEEVKESL
jgi:GTP-binding protein